jgi:dTDP-4-amino-4,6-dideoxygalactose transaminase
VIWRCDLAPQYLEYRGEIDAAIARVLLSGRYTLASEVALFESEFADYVGVKHMVSVANATDGLTLALEALGVGPGSEVITTPFTAIPTVSSIVDAGAKPVFVDVDRETFLMDLSSVQSAITARTKAIMPVHIFGNAADIRQLRALAGEGIPILEDAAQAHGSTIGGEQCGSIGNAGVFSFYPTKNLGAYGDGGAIGTNSDVISSHVRLRRMYGMVDKDHIAIHGVNSRLDELQAAILRVKLKHLEEMNRKRRRIAARYRAELRPDLFECQKIPEQANSNYHVFVVRVTGSRDVMEKYLEDRGIQSNVYYRLPLYRQQAMEAEWDSKPLPVVEALCAEVLALPMYPELPEDILGKIIETANGFPG